MNRKVAFIAVSAALIMLAACAHDGHRYMGDVIGRDFEVDVSHGLITIVGYNGRSRNVHIPAMLQGMPVVGIGDRAFAGRMGPFGRRLNSVEIPHTVTFIGQEAFYRNRLESVHIPNSVQFIGDRAFAHNRLETVTISGRVNRIGSGVFENNRLEHITIPPGVTYIGDRAFANNRFEYRPFIPSSVIWIRERAFVGNQLSDGEAAHLHVVPAPVGGPVNVISLTGIAPTQTGFYTLHLGTFAEAIDAQPRFYWLRAAGLNPSLEVSGAMHHLLIPGVRGAAITAVAQQIALGGFETIDVRRGN